jgi:hypothetical protein
MMGEDGESDDQPTPQRRGQPSNLQTIFSRQSKVLFYREWQQEELIK